MTAIELSLGGDKKAGLRELTCCWEQTTEADHAIRCIIAHYLADLQPNLDDEVAWDERALIAFPHVGNDALAVIGIRDSQGLASSLHLNLGDGYFRQGRIEDAQAQLEAGLARQDALGEDEYGALVRSGLARLEQRIKASRPSRQCDCQRVSG
jgi:hypothetical protein